jgi:hypothetical protein
MLKPILKNIVLFFFVKYLLFYIFMMFRTKDYTLIQVEDLQNGEDIFYYLFMFLFLPVLCSVIFSGPIYLSFKVKKAIYFIFLLCLVFTAEYILYTYFASQVDLMNGLFNIVIGLVVLLLLFYKHIKSLFKRQM